MTLALNEISPQVRAMGSSLQSHLARRDEAKATLLALLKEYSTAYSALNDRVVRAAQVQQQQRFDWVGAAPTNEPLAEAISLPASVKTITVIASDGSQILPDQHAITLYYLINVGSIVYQHGSGLKPITHNPKPVLCYEPDDVLDDQGRVISTGEVNVRRDLAELQVLADLAPQYIKPDGEPVITLMDGQLNLRVIDLSYQRQQECQRAYIKMLNQLRDSGALMAAYIDRPRSTFVISLMQLASLDIKAINESSLRHNPFRHLTDIDIFQFLGPGERSAMFSLKAKGMDSYSQARQATHFFYLNVSPSLNLPILARVEVPAWLVTHSSLIDTLHATLVRQARLAGNYPYVLARAHELAIISPEERQAVEMMLAVEMRRQGILPHLSAKQSNKNLLTGRESFRL
ncbi:DNA double-strand break repair nuclease NurA [Anaerolineales bacterium HSG6]|nr:DNA double-strand break repair nuclease NurA [Anaerolineales bacterium HSG6]MDM8529528.1 DNA double-strand break repair nuclease NurA [Anaerolineales bacterium HSG25]